MRLFFRAVPFLLLATTIVAEHVRASGVQLGQYLALLKRGGQDVTLLATHDATVQTQTPTFSNGSAALYNSSGLAITSDQLCWSSTRVDGTGYVACSPADDYSDAAVIVDAPTRCPFPGQLSAADTGLLGATCGTTPNAILFSIEAGGAPTMACFRGSLPDAPHQLVLSGNDTAAIVSIVDDATAVFQVPTSTSVCGLELGVWYDGAGTAACRHPDNGTLFILLSVALNPTTTVTSLLQLPSDSRVPPAAVEPLPGLPTTSTRMPVACVVPATTNAMYIAMPASTAGGDDGAVYKLDLTSNALSLVTASALGDITAMAVVPVMPSQPTTALRGAAVYE